MAKPRIEPTLSPTPELAVDKQGAPLALAEQPAYARILRLLAEVDEVDRRIDRDERRDRARARTLRPAVIGTGDDDLKRREARDEANFEALRAGGFAPKHPPESGLAAAQQERAVTTSRRIRLNAELREINRDLSHEVDKRNGPQDRAALAKIYEGLALTAEALSTIHARRARALALGYRPFEGVVLPNGFVASDRIPALAFLIGAPDNIASELGRFRRWLVNQEIL